MSATKSIPFVALFVFCLSSKIMQKFCILVAILNKKYTVTKGIFNILNGLLFDINYINTIYPENDIDMYLK